VTLTLLFAGEVIIKALPPVPTKGLTADEINDLIEKIHNIMETEYGIMYDEIASKLPKEHPFFISR